MSYPCSYKVAHPLSPVSSTNETLWLVKLDLGRTISCVYPWLSIGVSSYLFISPRKNKHKRDIKKVGLVPQWHRTDSENTPLQCPPHASPFWGFPIPGILGGDKRILDKPLWLWHCYYTKLHPWVLLFFSPFPLEEVPHPPVLWCVSFLSPVLVFGNHFIEEEVFELGLYMYVRVWLSCHLQYYIDATHFFPPVAVHFGRKIILSIISPSLPGNWDMKEPPPDPSLLDETPFTSCGPWHSLDLTVLAWHKTYSKDTFFFFFFCLSDLQAVRNGIPNFAWMLFTNTIWPVLLEIMLGSRTGKYKESQREIWDWQAIEADPHPTPTVTHGSATLLSSPIRLQGTETEVVPESHLIQCLQERPIGWHIAG